MSVFDRQGPPLAGSTEGAGNGQESPDPDGSGESGAAAMSGERPAPTKAAQSYDAHEDARALVRLVQCQRCSLPLRQPMTLACGNSLCRGCLPNLHKREHITYPATRGRSEGFNCSFAECGQEHSMGDCSNDVTLSKLLERVSVEIAKYRPLTRDTPTLLDERLPWRNVVDSCADPSAAHSRVLNGGRLVATFTMAELGELEYDADVSYQTCSPTGDTYQHLDYGMLEHLWEATRNELDCQVCFALVLDPLTLSCGHTFCRKCVARVLDHSQTCPACRRPLLLTPGALQSAESNKPLSKLLLALCPNQVAARAQQVEAEEAELAKKQQIPLFVCTLAYPRVPTFLHIFEPRYRLMIRRAMETDRKFGMLAYNSRGEPQGELGVTQFLQYGTLLEIVNMHLFPNGRSVIETVGVSRFCVREYGMCDGYTVGRVERIDDVPVAEEEAIEALQVSGVAPGSSSSALNTDPVFMSALTPTCGSSNNDPTLEAMPTAQLMDICTDFIRRMRSASAHWLSNHIIQAYGPMPEDPAAFPYWFASVLPINEAEKYRLIPTRSVRVRLMICAEWIRRVERTRW
jgi:ATP-dependent protease La (LON) substrate-binding domain/Zinc finger, C3HC4 type (RING finger)